MPRRIRKRIVLASLAAVLLGCVHALNASPRGQEAEGAAEALAHRGVHQTFPVDEVEADTCTAELIHPPEHGYLENTVPSIRAAFAAGAAQVELDVHITADGDFAVFHDWTVDCRTDGSGTTRELTMDELRELDIGYGYTGDGGRTHPFRGEGAGLMPSLGEVLAEFPREELLVHIKSDDPQEGEALAAYLAGLEGEHLDRLTVYGGDRPVRRFRERLPDVRAMSLETMVSCLGRYTAVGWTGRIPRACAGTQLHIPEAYAPLLWGWPTRFTERMESVGTRVVLVAGSGGFSEGFDTPESLERVPRNYPGMVWTNRAEEIAPLLAERENPS